MRRRYPGEPRLKDRIVELHFNVGLKPTQIKERLGCDMSHVRNVIAEEKRCRREAGNSTDRHG